MESFSLDTQQQANASTAQTHIQCKVKNTSRPIIQQMQTHIQNNVPFYSFEFFPPKTPAGLRNLYARMDRMSALEPMFIDVTWGAGGSTAERTLELSINAQKASGAQAMMHLTCTNMTRARLEQALEDCKKNGIRNILALRGDPPKGEYKWSAVEGGFTHAIDLVRLIRDKYGDYFGIAVAGYPEKHGEAADVDADIQFLKEKCEAGADFIITQPFYDVGIFVQWVGKCRKAGITVPIIPGVMPIQNFKVGQSVNQSINRGGGVLTYAWLPFKPNTIPVGRDQLQRYDRTKERGISMAVGGCEDGRSLTHSIDRSIELYPVFLDINHPELRLGS